MLSQRDHSKKIKQQEHVTSISETKHQSLIYISNLPVDVIDDSELERLIIHRIENSLRIKLNDVKCYGKLGVGFIRVNDSQLKDYFIKDVQKLILDTNESTTTVTFVEVLKFVSYIVLDMEKDKNNLAIIPTSNEVKQAWFELHKWQTLQSCDQLHSQFPNIYRLVSTSLDEILKSINQQHFFSKNQIGYVYYCATCSFLEDLPKSITRDQLKKFISTDIQLPNISSSSLAVEINKRSGNACIIVTDIARKWSTKSFLHLNERIIYRKDTLPYRLLLHPVPQTLTLNSILNHGIFSGKITNHKHNEENLIIDLFDKYTFDKCMKNPSLSIDNQHIIHIEEYNVLNNIEQNEIDATSWYETEMLQYKPDIMQFLKEPRHVILSYKWNAQIWLEQLKRSISMNSNKTIHLLRMTVMLNTIGILCKKSYIVDNREVKLNVNSKLRTIIYNHRSKLKRSDKMSLTTVPYPKTNVYVVRDDYFIVYEQLIQKGKRPVLVNIANTTNYNDGYKKGEEGQEEDLFRRSDCFRSLDIDLEKILLKPSEHSYCSHTCQLESLSKDFPMYPIDEYGAIYTSGLTIFRQSEEKGYAYMSRPLENVSLISIGIYENPKLEGHMLTSKYAIGLRKKIENIFTIAYHHNHDSLILPILTDDIYRTSFDHILKIFQSVIEQYAGFFNSITFVISDKQYSKCISNHPEINNKLFQELDGMIVQSMKIINTPNIMYGSYRFLSDGITIKDINIFDLPLCQYGAKCRDIYNSNHIHEFSHPPLCPQEYLTGTCTLTNDIVHMSLLVHQNQCQYGGECRDINNEKHSQEFKHPPYCPTGGMCQNMQKEHLKQYRHVPLCKHALKCMDYKKHSQHHCNNYRHCMIYCSYGSYCPKFHDKQHMEEFQHPFPTPCLRTPFHCPFFIELCETNDIRNLPRHIQQHCLDFAHVCRYGRNCIDKTPIHWEKCIHIARSLCSYDDKCMKLHQEDHLNSFTHSNIRDIRLLCRFTDKCHDRQKLDHIMKFRHAVTFTDSGIVQYFDLNKKTNFIENQMKNIQRINSYIKAQSWKSLSSGLIPSEILHWIRTVQPVHRCSPIIFESILLHGHVMSRSHMENLKKPEFVANSVLQHSRIRSIENLKEKTCAELARKYVTILVKTVYDKHGFPDAKSLLGHSDNLKKEENILSAIINSKDMEALRGKTIEIAQASIKLHSDPAGIGFDKDKNLRTDKTVFSILGPHLGHYYGDVCIVFKREILHHPDANFSMQAATFYPSGHAYTLRPWLGTAPSSNDQRIKQFHEQKLNASVPGYEYATALELIALTSHMFSKTTMDIDLETILQRWIKVDSHQNIEGHLPTLIPLDYIDHIYIPKDIYDSLNSASHRAINAVFKNSITITEHVGTISPPVFNFIPKPPTQARTDYQNFIIDQLIKRYHQYTKNPLLKPIQGVVITIPSTNFKDHILLPYTISQAYIQYSNENKHTLTDKTVYIYWQAMNGDMMLILSNEQIDPNESQPNLRCLLSYVAHKCTSDDSQYYEHSSYINSGHPFQHHQFVQKNKYLAKSNLFHVGCNTDDFLTYCLEIQYSTGKVSLFHAGSNSIYNNEIISYTFNKSELDLTKLDYIQISAGAHTVPVRNLIVCFEKQIDLHPIIDKEFSKNAATNSISKTNDEHISSLKPCSDNVNCLIQYSSDGTAHNLKYSHPCRFSELCRNKEAHLTHELHQVSMCNHDKDCNKLNDPIHRAKYRHTDLPDFLIPCQLQNQCKDKSDKHRIKYSHGEQVFESKDKKGSSHISSDQRIPCKWGSQCRDIDNKQHCTTYTHHSTKNPKNDDRIPCKWGSQCRTIGDADHRAKYSHSHFLTDSK
ncbi:unnamed protein product [Adineta steineri]|uniref:Microbial-type PARG catalytic domain-containing protein n=1 Tax=Adineta steineri TaxID=433720 RepID=A0A813NZP4_9BILA|nr:unnamed protein product [Adineta steineri]